MKNLFHPDSPVMRFLTTLFNLIILNLLWLLTSLPVITVGASSSALFSVLFQYLDQGSDTVLKPYFKAFAVNFKQSTTVWIPILLVSAILSADALYLTNPANQVSELLWIPFILLLLVLLCVTCYVFGLIARFENTLRDTLRNSVLLFLLNLFPSISIILVQALPLLVFFILPSVFIRGGILWLMLGVSAFAYINASTMLRIFKKHMDKNHTQENQQHSDTH